MPADIFWGSILLSQINGIEVAIHYCSVHSSLLCRREINTVRLTDSLSYPQHKTVAYSMWAYQQIARTPLAVQLR